MSSHGSLTPYIDPEDPWVFWGMVLPIETGTCVCEDYCRCEEGDG